MISQTIDRTLGQNMNELDSKLYDSKMRP